MDEHLARALYLGAAILMAAAAFMTFFALFGGYQDYYSRADTLSDYDRIVIKEPSASEPFMRGGEVINLILEKKHADEETALREFNADTPVQDQLGDVPPDYSEPLPEIYVGLTAYEAVDLASINPNDTYDVVFAFDSSGRPLRIDLIKR